MQATNLVAFKERATAFIRNRTSGLIFVCLGKMGISREESFIEKRPGLVEIFSKVGVENIEKCKSVEGVRAVIRKYIAAVLKRSVEIFGSGEKADEVGMAEVAEMVYGWVIGGLEKA